MTPPQKANLRAFIPETLLYGLLAAGYCFAVARLLSRPLVTLFHDHRAEYGLLALALVIVQGFVLERMTHALCSLFRAKGKAPR